MNEPYLNRLNSFTADERHEFQKKIARFRSKSKSLNDDEYREIIEKMGYTSLEEYKEVNSAYFNSLQNFITENPEIKLLDEEQQRNLFIELFKDDIQIRSKSADPCTYQFSYCNSQAKGTYFAGSGVCALGFLGGPIGAFGAVGCQLINTAIYENAKADCLRSYNQCAS